MYKIHHSVADGIANILMFFELTDEPKFKEYPPIMLRFGWVQDIMIKLCAPLLVHWLTIKYIFLKAV